jgi:phosphoglycolate phosphatase
LNGTLKEALRGVGSLIFDLDGTLVDSYAAIAAALNATLSEHRRAPRPLDEVRGAVVHGLADLLGQYLPPESLPSAVGRFREEYRKVFLDLTEPLPGMQETLHRLHERGFGLSVASNKPAEFSREILGHLGVLPQLVSVRGPGSDTPPKPHPAMLRACLRDLGASSTDCVYVGDMALDVESASRAGLPVLLVPTGSSSRAALVETGHPVLGAVSDLLEFLAAPAPRGR